VAHQIPRLRTKLLINNGPSDGMPIAFVRIVKRSPELELNDDDRRRL